MFRINFHVESDWSGDLRECVRLMRALAGFCIAMTIAVLLLMPIYNILSKSSRPQVVYTDDDWKAAAANPFIHTVILKTEIHLEENDMPERELTVIEEF